MGPLRLVLVDTGLTGRVDAEQARWLRTVSADDRPKILLAARPVFAGARLHRIPLDDGGAGSDLNEIVTDPAYGYVAAIGGGDHNYQRYPVRLARRPDDPVRGGRRRRCAPVGHPPHPERRPPRAGGVRGRLPLLPAARRLAGAVQPDTIADCSASAASRSAPDDATTIMAERIGNAAPRPSTPSAEVPARARRAAGQIYPLPATGQVLPGDPPPALIEPRRPPLFRSVLRIDATSDEIVVSCFAATGAGRTGAGGPRAGPPRRPARGGGPTREGPEPNRA